MRKDLAAIIAKDFDIPIEYIENIELRVDKQILLEAFSQNLEIGKLSEYLYVHHNIRHHRIKLKFLEVLEEFYKDDDCQTVREDITDFDYKDIHCEGDDYYDSSNMREELAVMFSKRLNVPLKEVAYLELGVDKYSLIEGITYCLDVTQIPERMYLRKFNNYRELQLRFRWYISDYYENFDCDDLTGDIEDWID